MMLRNHGMLAVGETVSHAFMNAYYFQRSCEMQVATMSCNSPYREVPHEIGVAAARGFEQFSRARPCYDWDAMIRKISVRLGVPVFPGHTLTYTGEVTGVREDGDEGVVEIALRAQNELGDHVSGTATLTLPLERAR